MANNFGLGARKMATAGKYVAKRVAREHFISESHAAGMSMAWAHFCHYAEDSGISKMEYVTPELLISYGKELALRVEEHDLAPGTAQGYISAVNTIMHIATDNNWVSVSATKDCHIPQRSFSRTEPPVALDRNKYVNALEIVCGAHGAHGMAIVELCRELGLRSKEASLLNACTTLAAAKESGVVTISAGTKGGRDRALPIITPNQFTALEHAANVQSGERSMIPAELYWKQWRERGLRHIRETVQTYLSGDGLHDLRSSYACERYQVLTGFAAPVCGGERPDRDADCAARLQIAQELGHGRIDVTNAYLGGRKP